MDFLPASHLSVQSQIALFSAHAGVAADIQPLGVPAPPGAPPCSYHRGPPGGASPQGCSPAQTAAARRGASPAKLHPPPRTSPSKARPGPARAAAAVSHPCFVKHTLCRFRPHLPVAMGVFYVATSRDTESLDFELQIVGVGVSAALPGRMEGASASILTFLLKELAKHQEFSLRLLSGPLSLRGEKFFRKVSSFLFIPRDHFTHPFFASRVDGTVERGNPALWLCLSSPTGTRATKATEDPTLSSMQASQLEEARRQRPRGHQEAFEPAERAWQHNAERRSNHCFSMGWESGVGRVVGI